MPNHDSSRPVFGQPGWRRRMEDRYGWDKEFAVVGVIVALFLLSLSFVHAGDNASGPQDDPKQINARPENSSCSTDEFFLPLPSWSHFTKMPLLPNALTPMGAVANKAKPSPEAVAETKPDVPPMPKKLPQIGPLATSATPAPAPSNKPELETISPFLQWIKDHPKEAAAAARQEAASTASQPSGPVGPSSADPYWMPPMIDQPVQAGSDSSSATYTTPQK